MQDFADGMCLNFGCSCRADECCMAPKSYCVATVSVDTSDFRHRRFRWQKLDLHFISLWNVARIVDDAFLTSCHSSSTQSLFPVASYSNPLLQQAAPLDVQCRAAGASASFVKATRRRQKSEIS
jgi:hypothetical protein